MKDERIVSYYMALLPLMAGYTVFPGTNLDLGLLGLVFIIFFCRTRIRSISCVELFLIYILLLTPFLWLAASEIYGEFSAVFLRWVKYLAMIIIFIFMGIKDRTNINLMMSLMHKVIAIAVVFLIFQRFFYELGIIIENPLVRFTRYEGYMTEDFLDLNFFRPSAFFLEPAHFSQYCIPYLIYKLYEEENIKHFLFASLGILMTGSGQGLVFVVLLLTLKIFLKYRENIILMISSLGMLVFSFLVLIQIDFLSRVLGRLGKAFYARVGDGFRVYLDSSIWEIFWGHGLGNIYTPMYYNGNEYILFTLGVIGLLLFFISFLIQLFKLDKSWKKIGMAMFLLTNSISATFTPDAIVHVLTIYKNDRKKSK